MRVDEGGGYSAPVTPPPAPKAKPDTSSHHDIVVRPDGSVAHRVGDSRQGHGETLAELGKRFDMTLAELRDLNKDAASKQIKPGDEVVVLARGDDTSAQTRLAYKKVIDAKEALAESIARHDHGFLRGEYRNDVTAAEQKLRDTLRKQMIGAVEGKGYDDTALNTSAHDLDALVPDDAKTNFDESFRGYVADARSSVKSQLDTLFGKPGAGAPALRDLIKTAQDKQRLADHKPTNAADRADAQTDRANARQAWLAVQAEAQRQITQAGAGASTPQEAQAAQYARAVALATYGPQGTQYQAAVEGAFSHVVAGPAAAKVAAAYQNGGAMAGAKALHEQMQNVPPEIAVRIYVESMPTIDRIAAELGQKSVSADTMGPAVPTAIDEARKGWRASAGDKWEISSRTEYDAVVDDLAAATDLAARDPGGAPSIAHVADTIVSNTPAVPPPTLPGAVPWLSTPQIPFVQRQDGGLGRIDDSLGEAVGHGNGSVLSVALATSLNHAAHAPGTSSAAAKRRTDQASTVLTAAAAGVRQVTANNAATVKEVTTPPEKLSVQLSRWGKMEPSDEKLHKDVQDFVAKNPDVKSEIDAKTGRADRAGYVSVRTAEGVRDVPPELRQLAGYKDLVAARDQMVNDKDSIFTMALSKSAKAEQARDLLTQLGAGEDAQPAGKPPNLLWGSRIARGLVGAVASAGIPAPSLTGSVDLKIANLTSQVALMPEAKGLNPPRDVATIDQKIAELQSVLGNKLRMKVAGPDAKKTIENEIARLKADPAYKPIADLQTKLARATTRPERAAIESEIAGLKSKIADRQINYLRKVAEKVGDPAQRAALEGQISDLEQARGRASKWDARLAGINNALRIPPSKVNTADAIRESWSKLDPADRKAILADRTLGPAARQIVAQAGSIAPSQVDRIPSGVLDQILSQGVSPRAGITADTTLGKFMSGLGIGLYVVGAVDLMNPDPRANSFEKGINIFFGAYILGFGGTIQTANLLSGVAQSWMVGPDSKLFPTKFPVGGALDTASDFGRLKGVTPRWLSLTETTFEGGAALLILFIAGYEATQGKYVEAGLYTATALGGALPLLFDGAWAGPVGAGVTLLAIVGLYGWKEYQRAEAAAKFEGSNRDFLQLMGVSPEVAKIFANDNDKGISVAPLLDAIAERKGIPPSKMLDWMKSLTPDEAQRWMAVAQGIEPDDKGSYKLSGGSYSAIDRAPASIPANKLEAYYNDLIKQKTGEMMPPVILNQNWSDQQKREAVESAVALYQFRHVDSVDALIHYTDTWMKPFVN